MSERAEQLGTFDGGPMGLAELVSYLQHRDVMPGPPPKSLRVARSVGDLGVARSAETPAEAEDWRKEALCGSSDPDAFFPEKGASTQEAKKICGRCPVKGQCLEYALGSDEPFGIWGGMTARERRRLRRRA